MEETFPHVVFYIFPWLPIYDSVISTWVLIGLVIGGVLVARALKPAALEVLVAVLNDMVSDVMGRPAEPFLPFLGSLMIFIAAANVVGVIPFLTNPASDINTPIALAVAVFFSVHYFGTREQGLWGYIKDLATPIFVLPLEIIGQFSRTISLTLRLFGNMISIDLVVAVVFALIPLLVPLPVIGFNLFTGFLQAYIFTALAAVYIGSALGPEERQKGEN